MSISDSSTHRANRLIDQTSPYLLQHAYNPVDWYPWGPEAIEAARSQDKVIFLSVGYSTSYWCHVMERQCFEVPGIAAEMNRRMINIKVDREERPDLDQLYMTAVQLVSGHGGWPMSVFLTPELKPIHAGTYYPPTDMHGRPGLLTLMAAVEEAYRNRKGEVQAFAERLTSGIRKYAQPPAPDQATTIDLQTIQGFIERSVSDYDADLGGFGGAPKFPRETLLELILSGPEASPHDRPTQMVLRTLDAMAEGGIRDHLGGAFHRYSTDAQWLVPHFEIMLYDNAMLAWTYARAFALTREPRYAAVARGICDFVLREMTSAEGAFYTALDAEVDAQEGLSYLWTRAEVKALLGEKSPLFERVYGLDRGPNFADPHHGNGIPDKNILYLPNSIAEVAKSLSRSVQSLEAELAPMREALYAARRHRKQPLLDTKILTSWNGLMIRGLAFVGQTLNEPKYIEAAAKGADFLLAQHRTPDGGLWRTSRQGKKQHAAFLDDYSFLAQALLQLEASTGDARWKSEASALAEQMVSRFHDPEQGGFFYTAGEGADLIVRQKVGTDSPLPSGNAVAALVCLSLEQGIVALDTIRLFSGQLEKMAESMSAMVLATLKWIRTYGSIEVLPQARTERLPSVYETAEGVVRVTPRWEMPDLLLLELEIAPGFHIYTNNAPPGLVATRVALLGSAAELVCEVNYPQGKSLYESGSAEKPHDVMVYTDKMTAKVFLAKPINATVEVSIRFQACDATRCLPPITRRVSVEAAGVESKLAAGP